MSSEEWDSTAMFPSVSGPNVFAPRPIKARPRQKSIISLENFHFANGGWANTLVDGNINNVNRSPAAGSAPFRPTHLSRKSSLMGSWDVKNVSLTGSKLVGDTEVSLIQDFINGSPCKDIHQRNESVENFNDDFRSMHIYSNSQSMQDSVDELLNVVRSSRPVSKSGFNSKRSSIDTQFSFPSNSSGQQETSEQQQQFQASSPVTSFDNFYAFPSSPIIRHSRNPIISNSSFQNMSS